MPASDTHPASIPPPFPPLLLALPKDPVEHRFGHMRQGLGSHRNPTATQAKERAARGDLNRGLHGGSRANHNRNARAGNDFMATGVRGDIMLPLQGGKSGTIRAPSRKSHAAVVSPRYISYVRPPAPPAPSVEDGSASQESTPVSAGQANEIVNPYTHPDFFRKGSR